MIRIDGVNFDVPVSEVDMKADYLYKYAERTADGKLHSEMIGVYFNYSIKFGTSLDTTTYAALWAKLTEPTEYHTVRVWDATGVYDFTAYFAGVTHKLRKLRGSNVFWKELTVNFIARSPART